MDVDLSIMGDPCTFFYQGGISKPGELHHHFQERQSYLTYSREAGKITSL